MYLKAKVPVPQWLAKEREKKETVCYEQSGMHKAALREQDWLDMAIAAREENCTHNWWLSLNVRINLSTKG